jgi:hypothetical protein
LVSENYFSSIEFIYTELRKGMFEAIMTSIGWLADHTDRAKELSIQYINKTSEAYNSGDQSWSR